MYGHIHRGYIRNPGNGIIASTGSVSLSYDGDPRASYLLIDRGAPQIRRIEYDVEKEIKALKGWAFPHADWIARTLKTASPQMP